MSAPRLSRFRRAISCTIITALSLIVVARSHAQGNAPDNKNSSAGVISGKVSTRDGEVTPNARVSVGRASGGSSSQVLRVDNNGHFETQPLEPGLYFISVFAPGYTTDTSQPSTLSSILSPRRYFIIHLD